MDWFRGGPIFSFQEVVAKLTKRTPSKERILIHFVNPDHPVCAAAEASHLFLDGAATPPVSGGELLASHSFTTFETAPTIDCDVLNSLFKGGVAATLVASIKHYCARSATVGSTLLARRAGR